MILPYLHLFSMMHNFLKRYDSIFHFKYVNTNRRVKSRFFKFSEYFDISVEVTDFHNNFWSGNA